MDLRIKSDNTTISNTLILFLNTGKHRHHIPILFSPTFYINIFISSGFYACIFNITQLVALILFILSMLVMHNTYKRIFICFLVFQFADCTCSTHLHIRFLRPQPKIDLVWQWRSSVLNYWGSLWLCCLSRLTRPYCLQPHASVKLHSYGHLFPNLLGRQKKEKVPKSLHLILWIC